jgi:hypothetical protein
VHARSEHESGVKVPAAVVVRRCVLHTQNFCDKTTLNRAFAPCAPSKNEPPTNSMRSAGTARVVVMVAGPALLSCSDHMRLIKQHACKG